MRRQPSVSTEPSDRPYRRFTNQQFGEIQSYRKGKQFTHINPEQSSSNKTRFKNDVVAPPESSSRCRGATWKLNLQARSFMHQKAFKTTPWRHAKSENRCSRGTNRKHVYIRINMIKRSQRASFCIRYYKEAISLQ